MEEKKYEITDEIWELDGHTLHRIRALRDFGEVTERDPGGFIESEDNLSHEGNCWVGDEATVYGKARVYGDAMVYDYASVYDEACIFGDAEVCENVDVYGHAKVYGKAEVYGDAKVHGNAEVYENAVVKGNAEIGGWGTVKGTAEISEGKVFLETIYGGKSVIWKLRKNPEID